MSETTTLLDHVHEFAGRGGTYKRRGGYWWLFYDTGFGMTHRMARDGEAESAWASLAANHPLIGARVISAAKSTSDGNVETEAAKMANQTQMEQVQAMAAQNGLQLYQEVGGGFGLIYDWPGLLGRVGSLRSFSTLLEAALYIEGYGAGWIDSADVEIAAEETAAG